jgi:catechol 2,3-dioxygenase-like lactoylglutathione lyase family enzyme
MLTGQLFHVAIKTADLTATIAFYTRVLGMTLDTNRPAFGFPGAWLIPTIPGGAASIHVYAGDAAKEADGGILVGTGAVDHVSLTAHGISAFRNQFRKLDLPWRENLVPNLPLSQLFVHDPNGVLLELTFHTASESEPHGEIAQSLQYLPKERWFAPSAYTDLAKRCETIFGKIQ